MTSTQQIVPHVYLAGGFRSRWQRRVHERLGTTYVVLDPAEHGLTDRIDYTRWDLSAIKRCDVLLAYMEALNPAGYSLALEVGYAHALGKPIIYVCELEGDRARYFEMVRTVATYEAGSLNAALDILEQLGAGQIELRNPR
jgi:nucleoside 2-deoxyribosyltransferase